MEESLFPLYENLCKKLSEKTEVEPINEILLKEYTSSLNATQYEHVSLLILTYYYYSNNRNLDVFKLHSTDKKKYTLPYGIKINPGGKGFTMDVNHIPQQLQYLIWEYFSQ